MRTMRNAVRILFLAALANVPGSHIRGEWLRAGPAAQAPAGFEATAARAAAAQQANRVDEAVGFYRQALQMKPGWTEGLWRLGSLLYANGRHAEARDAFVRLAYLRPGVGAGWAMIGLCEFATKQYERALTSLQHGNALGLDDNPDLKRVSLYHMAILLNRGNVPEAALQILGALAQMEGGDDPAMMEALGLAGLAAPLLPGEEPAERRAAVMKCGEAQYHLARRNGAEAQRHFKELLARFPDVPGVHYSLGLYSLKSDPDAALAHFKRELDISPRHVRARLQLAFLYVTRGENEAALSYGEEAVKLDPGFFVAHNALGQILIGLGQIERAIRELETSVKLQPDSPEARFHLARAYREAGRLADAARERTEFSRLDKLRRARDQAGNRESK